MIPYVLTHVHVKQMPTLRFWGKRIRVHVHVPTCTTILYSFFTTTTSPTSFYDRPGASFFIHNVQVQMYMYLVHNTVYMYIVHGCE